MAITPNYSWPLPDDTDLVKDGAEAIRDLGNAIDTTVDGLPGAGLVHIETQTFSAVGAVNFNSVFSAAYDNYLIMYNNVTSSSGTWTNIRMRNGTTDFSSSNYFRQALNFNNTSVTAAREQNVTAWNLVCFIETTFQNLGYMNLWNPFNTVVTTASNEKPSELNNNMFCNLAQWSVNTSTSYDGFSVLVNSGGVTISGSISVYGYKK
jgi:hypothetical protein